LFFPEYGIGSGIFEGNWQGIYNQKNILGRIMVLSSLVSFLFLLENNKKRIFKFIVFILSIVLIILSDSKTSLVVLIILMSLLPLLKVFSFGSYLSLSITTFISLILFLIVVISINQLNFLLSLLGKDISLTGRIPLWEISILMIKKSLLTGYGFDAFWESPQGPVSQVFQFVGWEPTHAHNGFIDLFLDLGLLGFLFFSFIYIKSIKNSLFYKMKEKNAFSLFPLLYLIYFLLINLNESSLVKPYSIFWILFVLNVCYLNKSVKEKQYIEYSTLKGEKI
jgi:exopolysaccharide production protein ExoQ